MGEEMLPTGLTLRKEITPINKSTYIVNYGKDFEIEIGDIEKPDFEPSIKLKRWQDECFCNIKYPTTLKETPLIDKKGEKITKIKWIGQDEEVHLYPVKKTADLPEGFEFEIILKKKPVSNVITLNIEIQGLKYYYQPLLTQEFKSGYSKEFKKEMVVTETDVKDLEGNVLVHRPENVVGSYAVYHESKQGNYEALGGKNYRAGKAFHIYRPKIIDSAGTEVWGELNIDEQTKTLTITIDQNWLDNAIYPVSVDPNFGYENYGATILTIENYLRGGQYSCPVAGTADSITAWLYNYIAVNDIKCKIYDTDGNSVGNETEEIEVGSSTSPQEITFNFSDPKPSLSATDYILISFAKLFGGLSKLYCDTTGGTGKSIAATYPTWPDEPVSFDSDEYKYSIYCTYAPTVGIVPVAMHHYRNMRES